MTSIPLSALGPGREWRRDGYGRYLIVPPEGGRPKGYARVTTVAGTLDSGGGLAPWKASMTACGIIMRRGLRAQWEALLAEYAGDPWYSGAKEACKKLVELSAAAGGADDRRDTGISLHTITALVDLNRALGPLTEETERDVEAYVNGLGAAGVSIVDAMVEVTVVLDAFRVAGTFDRLVTVPGYELPMVADLKTGASLSYSWQSIAVQLSAYANADAIYRQGPATDGSADERVPMPEVDREHGLVMWLDAGSGQLELHVVDLVAGWEAFERSMWVRDWRKTEVAHPLAEAAADWRQQLAASVAAIPQPAGDYTARLRAWLQERIDAIGAVPAAKTNLAMCWPPEMPTLHASGEHSPEQLADIERVLDALEAHHSIPFGPARPTTDVVGQLLHLFPNTTTITEESPP